MPNNVYQQFFAAQKAMFEQWQNYMKSAFKNSEANKSSEAMEYYNRMFEASQDFWQKAFDEWQKNFQTSVSGFSFNPAEYYAKMSETAQDFWKKAGESYKSYQAVYELWRKLNTPGWDGKDLIDTYEAWVKEWAGLIRDNFMPNMPGFVKNFAEKVLDNTLTASNIASDHLKTWAANNEDLKNAFATSLQDAPKGYIEMLEVWQKMYEDSFGKYMNAPTFGRDMEFWQHQKAAFDRFIKFNISSTRFYTAIYDVAEEATKKVLDDYVDMLAKGTQPKSFDDFYKYWSKVVSGSYDSVLFSEEMSQLAGGMVDAMSRYKMESDRMWEFYLANVPVPKKSDMTTLYKTVYQLKKDMRALQSANKENKTNE